MALLQQNVYKLQNPATDRRNIPKFPGCFVNKSYYWCFAIALVRQEVMHAESFPPLFHNGWSKISPEYVKVTWTDDFKVSEPAGRACAAGELTTASRRSGPGRACRWCTGPGRAGATGNGFLAIGLRRAAPESSSDGNTLLMSRIGHHSQCMPLR